MSNVLPNEGTSLSIELTADTFTVIPGVTSIDAPNPSVAVIPTTHLGTTGGHHTKRVSNLVEPGQLSFTFQYDPNDATHIALFTKFAAKAAVGFKLILVDGMATPANETFDAFITGIEGGGIEIETNHERTVNLEITGPITRTAGAA